MLKVIKLLSANKGNSKIKLLFVGYTCFLLIATLFPAGIIQSDGGSWFSKIQFKNEDKVIHFTLFFIFTLLFFFSAYSKKKIQLWLYPILLGILIEILQGWMNMGRTFDYWDILANSIGVFTAYFLLQKLPPHQDN